MATRKKCNPVLNPPKGKWIKATGVKFNRNGTVSIKATGKARKNPRNVAEGFYAGGVFHPIRGAYDYDRVRGGDDEKFKLGSVGRTAKKRKPATAKKKKRAKR